MKQLIYIFVGCLIASTLSAQSVNLKGKTKAQALVERFGPRGYDYAGNARDGGQIPFLDGVASPIGLTG